MYIIKGIEPCDNGTDNTELTVKINGEIFQGYYPDINLIFEIEDVF